MKNIICRIESCEQKSKKCKGLKSNKKCVQMRKSKKHWNRHLYDIFFKQAITLYLFTQCFASNVTSTSNCFTKILQPDVTKKLHIQKFYAPVSQFPLSKSIYRILYPSSASIVRKLASCGYRSSSVLGPQGVAPWVDNDFRTL